MRKSLFWIGASLPLLHTLNPIMLQLGGLPILGCMILIAISGEYKLAGLYYCLLAKVGIIARVTPLILWTGDDQTMQVAMFILGATYLMIAIFKAIRFDQSKR